VAETGSVWVQKRCRDATRIIALADIGRVEIAAAFAGKLRGGFITMPEYQSVRAMLTTDTRNRYHIVPVVTPRVDEAITLTARCSLRGYDAVHLACALFLNHMLLDNYLAPLLFISADDNLLKAAQAEGLLIANPNQFL